MKRAAPPAASTLIALVIVVGCGGGGGTESSANQSPPLSKQAFVKKADAVCTETQKRIETEFAAFIKKNKIKQGGQKGESPREAEAHGIEAIETIGIPQLKKQVGELRELEPPAEEKAKVDAYLTAIEKEVEDAEKDPRTLSGPASKVFAESDEAAKGIGFKVCAVHH